MNHLKQIGLGAHNFENVFKRFPPGYLGPIPEAPMPPFVGQFTGCLSFLLPYMEFDNVWSPMDSDMASSTGQISVFDIKHMGDPYYNREHAWEMAQTQISLFVCPDDLPYTKPNPWYCIAFYYQSPYANMVGILDTGSTAGSFDALGRTNYLGCGGVYGHDGYSFTDQYQGVFWNRSKIDFRDVTDGTSHRILFGESMGGIGNASIPAGISMAWAGAGVMWTGLGLSDTPSGGQFSSYHPGVVNFCLIDGSVRNISTKVNATTTIVQNGVTQTVSAFPYWGTIASGLKTEIQ